MALAAHAARVVGQLVSGLGARLRVWRWSSLRGGAVVGLALAWAGPSAAAPPTPAFEDPAPHTSYDGSLQLEWPGELGDYEVQLRPGPNTEPNPHPDSHDDPSIVVTRVVYRGRMPSAHLSGLLEGDYLVRVRAHDDSGASSWSPDKEILVRHHPLPLVYALMGLGLLTFVGTAAVVLRSSRRAT